ncbi:fumarylacetoacetate hydrolase family protein [Roseomonas terrae]|uniref:Fumarylacetoacetate hydrolase family protein n=1 Tax=Neoroseomonas terrae TaxID=424799 RepID=A0ABS5EQ77_9PROT|nr:fumarylacetoacetate hydrolase family protein [Neoroseomonas terrae]MBR0653185.1 fumarylacetoacetate hydrolase family protein [Neoroseomonas terrae]
MKLATFEINTPLGPQRRVGVVMDAGIVDATAARSALLERQVPAAAAARIGAAQVPPEMVDLIGMGETGLDWVREAVAYVHSRGQEATGVGQRLVHAMDAITLLAPVPRPPGIANFSCWPAHGKAGAERGSVLKPAEEGGGILPYWKGNPDSYVGPGTTLRPPSYGQTSDLDVECEFVAIVGSGGRNLDRDAARRAIIGFTIVNDGSSRTRQLMEMKSGRGPAKGKDFDGGNIMGPWIVTHDEIGDLRDQRLSLSVNGEELSSASTADMSRDFEDMLGYLSLEQTIRPGHVISSGCYHRGCGMDLKRSWQSGERVELRVSGIGALVTMIG